MISSTRKDGREARRNEERIEKGSHCFFKSSGYDKLELKHQNLVFTSLAALLKKNIMVLNRMQKHVPLVNRM